MRKLGNRRKEVRGGLDHLCMHMRARPGIADGILLRVDVAAHGGVEKVNEYNVFFCVCFCLL